MIPPLTTSATSYGPLNVIFSGSPGIGSSMRTVLPFSKCRSTVPLSYLPISCCVLDKCSWATCTASCNLRFVFATSVSTSYGTSNIAKGLHTVCPNTKSFGLTPILSCTIFLMAKTKKLSTSKSFSHQDAVKDLKLHPENIAKFQFPETPPRTLTPLNVNLEIAHTK